MAKESMKAREVKRAKLVAKYAEKRKALKEAGEGAAVVKTDRGSVLGELVESCPVTGFLESLSLLGVLGDHLGALNLAGFH